MTELYYLQAIDLVKKVSNREISCSELMTIFLQRIEAVNPKINAICTLEADKAMAQAQANDVALANGVTPGPLFGLPIAIKDLAETDGIRTTFGSPLYKDFVPDFDQLFVSRIKQAGGIVIGKTNTPEFGAGSHTFNKLFGVTRNPYDCGKTAGGSSGGAGAALASGMIPIADGSDFGGSLRNPASFNNIVGFRPTPGRVPRFPNTQLRDTLAVMGPMAKTVKDTQLLFSVMAGPDLRDPLSLETAGTNFLQPLERDFKQCRIAVTEDLGQLAVDPAVREIVKASATVMQALGASVENDHPDLHDSESLFLGLRSSNFVAKFHPAYESIQTQLKDTIIWNYQQGESIDAKELGRLDAGHAELYQRALKFWEKYDYLILPSAQLPPFDIDIEWPTEIDNVKYTNYLQWMQVCCAVTLMGAPSISVPAGFTNKGLPVGIQIVGRPRDDLGVMQLAYAFEQATKFGDIRPNIPVSP